MQPYLLVSFSLVQLTWVTNSKFIQCRFSIEYIPWTSVWKFYWFVAFDLSIFPLSIREPLFTSAEDIHLAYFFYKHVKPWLLRTFALISMSIWVSYKSLQIEGDYCNCFKQVQPHISLGRLKFSSSICRFWGRQYGCNRFLYSAD